VVRLLEFSIVLTGIVLASPHTQRRYFVALYVPAVALVALLVRRPVPADKRSILIGLLAMAAPATILPLLLAADGWPCATRPARRTSLARSSCSACSS
jgi:hypothetical protein